MNLLRVVVNRHNADLVLLQEVWHPKEEIFIGKNYRLVASNLREDREGGGVVILAHSRVKAVEKKEYENNDLEATWAEVMVNGIRGVVGSVYIPPTLIEKYTILDNVIESIISKHERIIIGMDANARNALWDKSTPWSYSRNSKAMGQKLEEMIIHHGLTVHNTGAHTYHKDASSAALDVTMSLGFESKRVEWRVADDDIHSDHSLIAMQVGAPLPDVKRKMVDWEVFPWNDYCKRSKERLGELLIVWQEDAELSTDDMCRQLVAAIE